MASVLSVALATAARCRGRGSTAAWRRPTGCSSCRAAPAPRCRRVSRSVRSIFDLRRFGLRRVVLRRLVLRLVVLRRLSFVASSFFSSSFFRLLSSSSLAGAARRPAGTASARRAQARRGRSASACRRTARAGASPRGCRRASRSGGRRGSRATCRRGSTPGCSCRSGRGHRRRCVRWPTSYRDGSASACWRRARRRRATGCRATSARSSKSPLPTVGDLASASSSPTSRPRAAGPCRGARCRLPSGDGTPSQRSTFAVAGQLRRRRRCRWPAAVHNSTSPDSSDRPSSDLPSGMKRAVAVARPACCASPRRGGPARPGRRTPGRAP